MQVSVRTADRVIAQTGDGLGDLDGCAIEEVAADVERAIRQALATPNGGVVLSEDHATAKALPAPAVEPVVDPDAELTAAITAATTLAELKAALLGSRGGRVKARPRE